MYLSDSDSEDITVTPSEVCEYRDFPAPVVSVNIVVNDGLLIGALVVSDPVTQLLESLLLEERGKVIVAKDTEALRALWPIINGHSKRESINDMGSQIVAMAKAVAIQLGVAWDLDFRIKMQSANGQVELSEGLARNIPFQLGEVTAYLQVHVINNPAYEVLLGRPFDVLTKTISETLPDGGMLITVTDPNTGKRSTIPMFERGKGPVAKGPASEGFH